jgi:hypothetical protein
MPLVWQRKYDSSNPRIGLLGQGWTLLADAHLLIRPDKTLYIEPNGRELASPPWRSASTTAGWSNSSPSRAPPPSATNWPPPKACG